MLKQTNPVSILILFSFLANRFFMIKEYVCSKLNQYLSTFIDEIEENDLLLSLYDGNVQLHNVVRTVRAGMIN